MKKAFKAAVTAAVLIAVTATGAWGGCGSNGKQNPPPSVIPHH